MYIELPTEFTHRVQNDPFLGTKLLESLDSAPPVSVRLNPHKRSGQLPFKSTIPWCENAHHLQTRPSYVRDPHFHAGCYYPQEGGSMFLDFVLRNIALPEQAVILDLCAAPGGKSTLIASFLDNNGLLVSNEVIQARSKILKENSEKWGYTNTLVSNNDPKDFQNIPNTFDCIVLDAPCSGEGMFRKDPKSRTEWSTENVALCSARQRRITMDVWDSLKDNGYLIYSTCTFNASENEENIQWIMNQTGAQLVTLENNHWKAGRNAIGAYSLPSEQNTEGFYIAVLQKNQESKEKSPKNKKRTVNKDISRVKKEDQAFQTILHLDPIDLIQWREYVFAVPLPFTELVIDLQAKLKVIKMGTEIGKFIHGKLIPHEGLALNPSLLKAEAFPKIELELDDCLKYLRGETFPIELPEKVGFCIITFGGQNIGWIKNIGRRFNNLYPNNWRIRQQLS